MHTVLQSIKGHIESLANLVMPEITGATVQLDEVNALEVCQQYPARLIGKLGQKVCQQISFAAAGGGRDQQMRNRAEVYLDWDFQALSKCGLVNSNF